MCTPLVRLLSVCYVIALPRWAKLRQKGLAVQYLYMVPQSMAYGVTYRFGSVSCVFNIRRCLLSTVIPCQDACCMLFRGRSSPSFVNARWHIVRPGCHFIRYSARHIHTTCLDARRYRSNAESILFPPCVKVYWVSCGIMRRSSGLCYPVIAQHSAKYCSWFGLQLTSSEYFRLFICTQEQTRPPPYVHDVHVIFFKWVRGLVKITSLLNNNHVMVDAYIVFMVGMIWQDVVSNR